MADRELLDLLTCLPPDPGSRGRSCPDEGRLAAYADARLADEPRVQIERHLADCAACLGQVAFLSHVRSAEPPASVPCHWIEVALRPRRRGLGRILPVTAGTLAGALAAAFLLLFVQPGGDPLRLDRGPHETRSAPAGTFAPPRPSAGAPVLLTPGDGATLGRAGLAARWSEVPDALFYTVQLLSPEGDLLWEGRTDGTELALPGSLPLARGGHYFLWVEAHFLGGASSRSPAASFALDTP